MKVELVALALLMGAVTFPIRAIPLLAPGLDRLPPRALAFLKLVGPASLAALAATAALVVSRGGAGSLPALRIGIEPLAVAAGIALVAWRRNLLIGIALAVALTAAGRAVGL